MKKDLVKLLKPHQLGWLHRPELALNENEEVWEKPNGNLFTHDKRNGPLLISKEIKPK